MPGSKVKVEENLVGRPTRFRKSYLMSFSPVMHIPQFDQWPIWLRDVVLWPHLLGLSILTWLWWPKNDKGWNRFLMVFAYLIIFFLVMRFVFGMKKW